MTTFRICFCAGVACAIASASSASMMVSGSISTRAADGMVGGGRYSPEPPPPNAKGFEIFWEVSQNTDGTWHYEYTMLTDEGDPLAPAVSHAIFQLSANISSDDVFNFGGDVVETSFGTFGASPANPGIPGSIFGIKIDTNGTSPTKLSFDSTRMPMWGDFYAKGGSNSFAYNSDFGVAVANPNDFKNPAVSASGATLFKILVPDTVIPSPASAGMLGMVFVGVSRRRRA